MVPAVEHTCLVLIGRSNTLAVDTYRAMLLSVSPFSTSRSEVTQKGSGDISEGNEPGRIEDGNLSPSQ